MAVYRASWWGAVYLLGGLCSLVALAGDRVWVNAGAAALVGLAGAAASLIYGKGPSAGAYCRQALRFGGTGFVACVAFAGLAALVNLGAALLVAGLFVVVSPSILRCQVILTRRLAAQRAAARRVLLSPPPSMSKENGVGPDRTVAARLLSDVELCLAWCLSSEALDQYSPTVAQRTELVAARREYLNEIERRDPEGFQRWLASGAGPSSDPGEYLGTVSDPPPSDRDQPSS